MRISPIWGPLDLLTGCGMVSRSLPTTPKEKA
jgi:hypothetical protein